MSYVALYRKWRPDNFDEVKGQEAIVRTLRNQIIYDRIGHAYLFCGTRGTGKTSIAKLFAKAVNCENPKDGSPCNQCPSCQAINSQSSLDVREIDAASNNGVDYVRELREQVQYAPVMGRYKVYIIDEVHMLSSGAFNALLKTLEEPPSYVIFILATTEKHKIPVTILSRCQQYDFRRISTETITGHLKALMEAEEISVEEKALKYIARAADGSMRDALSLLDQCISFYLNQTLTYDNVLTVLGAVDITVFSRLMSALLSQDISKVLSIVDDVIMEGRELAQFLTDFLWYLRNLLILKDTGSNEDSLDLSTENIHLLKEDAKLVETGTLLRYIRVLSELQSQLRDSTLKRVLLEVGFIRLCLPRMETDTDSLLERLRQLEEKAESGGFAWGPGGISGQPGTMQDGAGHHGPSGGPTGDSTGGPGPHITGDMAALDRQFPAAQAEDLKKIAASWSKILAAAGNPMQKFLRDAKPVVSEDSKLIRLLFEQDSLSKIWFEDRQNPRLTQLSDLVAEITGKTVQFECITMPRTASSQTSFIDLSKIHQEVIIE